MLWLILLGALMWILQCVLGLLQFRRFNRHLKHLRSFGRVAIGRSKGRVVAGAVVLLCIDENCNIIKGEKIEGLTIFAGVKSFDCLNGINLLDLNEMVCAGLPKQTKKAVLQAVEDYKSFSQLELEKKIMTTANELAD